MNLVNIILTERSQAQWTHRRFPLHKVYKLEKYIEIENMLVIISTGV